MSRQAILTGFDERNLVVLRNEIQRLWDAVGSVSSAVSNTEDLIFGQGLVLKDSQNDPHYWRVTIDSTTGTLVTEDLGIEKP